ncbi:hypothetical protein LCGC14_3044380, partial [marine sediment metagenome]
MTLVKKLLKDQTGCPVRAISTALDTQAFIAGSAARHLLVGSTYDDIDVFLSDREFEPEVCKTILSLGFIAIGDTPNAREFYNPNRQLTLQLIKPAEGRSGSMAHVMEGFDFTVNVVAVATVGGKLAAWYHPQFYTAYDARTLVFVGSISDPPSMVYRQMKYYKKGYSVNPLMIAAVFEAWD